MPVRCQKGVGVNFQLAATVTMSFRRREGGDCATRAVRSARFPFSMRTRRPVEENVRDFPAATNAVVIGAFADDENSRFFFSGNFHCRRVPFSGGLSITVKQEIHIK